MDLPPTCCEENEEKKRGKWERRKSVKPERRKKAEKKRRRKKGKNALTRARLSEERTYRDVNQLVIKISEGFALNGPVTFIRPRFFDELSRERAPRLTSSGALSVFRHSRGLQFTHIRCRFPLMLLRPSAAFSPLLLNARRSYNGRASSSSSGKRRGELFWLSIRSHTDFIWIIDSTLLKLLRNFEEMYLKILKTKRGILLS